MPSVIEHVGEKPLALKEIIVNGRTIELGQKPVGVGNGVAHAEITSYDEALELAGHVVDCLEPIDEQSSTDCGDGRGALDAHGGEEGEETLVGSQLFGADVHATQGMLLLGGALPMDRQYRELYGTVARILAAKKKLGAHTDCGSLIKAISLYKSFADPDVAHTLLPVVRYNAAMLELEFSESEYGAAYDRANAIAKSTMFEQWNGDQDGTTLLTPHNACIRHTDEGEPGDPTHGHNENLIVQVFESGLGINKKRLYLETGKQVFVVTYPELITNAKLVTAEPSIAALRAKTDTMVQHGLTFQALHVPVVPDGSQYLMNIPERRGW